MGTTVGGFVGHELISTGSGGSVFSGKSHGRKKTKKKVTAAAASLAGPNQLERGFSFTSSQKEKVEKKEKLF